MLSGGGIAQVIMPNLTKRIAKKTPETIAWRWSFFLPGSLNILLGLAIMFFGQVRERKMLPCHRAPTLRCSSRAT